MIFFAKLRGKSFWQIFQGLRNEIVYSIRSFEMFSLMFCKFHIMAKFFSFFFSISSRDSLKCSYETFLEQESLPWNDWINPRILSAIMIYLCLLASKSLINFLRGSWQVELDWCWCCQKSIHQYGLSIYYFVCFFFSTG